MAACENGNDFKYQPGSRRHRELPQVFRCVAPATCAVESPSGRRLLLCDDCRHVERFTKGYTWYDIPFPAVGADGEPDSINPANVETAPLKRREYPKSSVHRSSGNGDFALSESEALELEYLKVRSIETLDSESCLNESECIEAAGLKEWQLREFLLDPEWAERWHKARQASYQRAADALESSMYKRAKGKSDKLAIFMMPALKPETYNPKSLQAADPSTVVNIGQLVITPRSEPEPKRIVNTKPVTESKD